MKTAVLALIVLSFALTVSAVPLASIAKAESKGVPLDVLHFVEGFALAVDAKVGNLSQCMHNTTITLDAFHVAVGKVMKAFTDLSIPELIDSLSYFGTGINDISLVLEACGETRLIKDIQNLAYELQKGSEGVITVIVKESLVIVTHKAELTDDFAKFALAWKAKQYSNAGVSAGKITVLLLEAFHEITAKK
jgi:hypothetical protein